MCSLYFDNHLFLDQTNDQYKEKVIKKLTKITFYAKISGFSTKQFELNFIVT